MDQGRPAGIRAGASVTGSSAAAIADQVGAEPGKGAVPVNPFQTGGGAAKSMPVSVMPRGK